jgi:replication initiation protein RepC
MSAPKAIGAYVKALFPTAHLCFTIGDRLETEQEKENYALWIRERASKMPNARADDMYKRAMNVLERLQEHRGCATSISRTHWSALEEIVKLLAHKDDWSNFDTGPIYGGSNATIADRLCLSVDRTKKILRELRRAGLLIFHQRHANGRRWIRRQRDGTPVGHGFSLLPIMVLLDELEGHVKKWREQAFEARRIHTAIVGTIAGYKQSLRAAHGQNYKTHPAIAACNNALHTAAVAKAARDVEHLKSILGDISEKSLFELPDSTPQGGQKNPSLSNLPQKDSKVDAWQGEGSEEQTVDSDFGLSTAKLQDNEIEQLFPIATPYLQLHKGLQRAVQHVARDSAISQDTLRRMRDKLGERAAAVTVLIIAERLAAGEIRSSSSAYAEGMMKAANRGQLQLGRTIWGRRELLAA